MCVCVCVLLDHLPERQQSIITVVGRLLPATEELDIQLITHTHTHTHTHNYLPVKYKLSFPVIIKSSVWVTFNIRIQSVYQHFITILIFHCVTVFYPELGTIIEPRLCHGHLPSCRLVRPAPSQSLLSTLPQAEHNCNGNTNSWHNKNMPTDKPQTPSTFWQNLHRF